MKVRLETISKIDHQTTLILKLEIFLTEFNYVKGGKDKSDSLVSHLKPLLKVFEGLFEKDEDELTAADPEVKKYHPAILSNISTLCSFIPPDNNVLSIEVSYLESSII